MKHTAQHTPLALWAVSTLWVVSAALSGCGDRFGRPLPTQTKACPDDTVCDDGNPCTDDRCGDAHCEFVPKEMACDDLDPCTQGDFCVDGACAAGTLIPGCGDPVQAEDAVIERAGTAEAFLLRGMVLAPGGAFEGEVLVAGEQIACVAPSCAADPLAEGAWVVDTRGVIAPGLIDTHNHILFDIFDDEDWVPNLPQSCSSDADCAAGSHYCSGDKCRCVDGVCRYTNHNQWPDEVEYQLMLDYKQCLADASQGKPGWCPQALDEDGDVKCEMHKWGELKGMVAGTTSAVGLPGTSAKCVGSLVRSIDVSQNDLEGDKIQTSALFPPSKSSVDGVCANFADGDTDAYLLHVGEGTDAKALAEFEKLYTVPSTDGCLFDERTAITHGTAFGEAEFASMGEAGMKLVWSPQSNVSLYGKTADIPLALSAGLTVALAPDWSMGGSQNLLDELRFADAWDNAHWGDVLSPEDLFNMVTANAAAVLGLEHQIGALDVGTMADLVVFAPSGSSPYEALLGARPATVRLVMIGGVPLFGDLHLRELGPKVPGCEAIELCGAQKFICVAEDNPKNKLDQSLADIELALEKATQSIDDLEPLDPSACGGCKPDEECFPYGAKPKVMPENCPEVCETGTACIQVKKSGKDPYQCRPVNTCSPAKSHTRFAPIAPLVYCPSGL